MKSTRNPQHARQAFAIKAIALAVASVFAQGAMADPALPTGFNPTSGGASITSQTANAMTINQTSQRALIDWATFNIGTGGTVTFTQPAVTSVVVNRVPLAGGQSIIDGALTANGNVMILNPNGVAFTSNAVVNVAGLVASTGNISGALNPDALDPIAITGATTGSITNQGAITVTNAGLAAFVAPSVTNSGTITASSGRVVLAGAQAATVSFNGSLYEIAINQPIPGGTVTNTGTVQATGGSIVLSAEDASSLVSGVINLSGIQQADRIEVNGNHVVLTSGLSAATVTGSSNTIDVQSTAKIQDGVNIAASGGTVNVAAGTYAEQLNITKSLSLVGAGANQTIIAPTSLAPVTYTSDSGPVDMRNILTIGGSSANSVDVSGFTFTGPVPAITAGIFVRDGAHAHIHDNKLIDIRESPTLSGNQRGVGILVGRALVHTSGTAVIENNVITGYQKGGIVIDGPGSQATITGNTVTGEGPTSVIAQNGIQVSRGANATLSGNTVRGNVYTGVSADPDDFAAGMLYFTSDPYVGQGGVTISANNTFTANQFGIWTNDPITLATISVAGATGNTQRNAVAFTSGGYAGQGPLLEYPAWAASNAALVDAGAFAGSLSGDILNVGGALRVSGWNGFAAIQPAINAVATGATVNVAAGTYAEQVNINKANLTLAGQTGARITVPDLAQVNGVAISANNVTVSGFEIAGPVTSSYLTYPWSNISRGIAVMNGVTGFTIANNNIHDVRNGILIDGRNTGSVTGNRIENTKSGISVQYTDGSGITISGNSQGPIGNEWGVNLHLNGFLVGSTIYTNPHLAAPTLTWQQALLALSAANGGWSVQDQGYSSSNRTHVQVATTGLSTNQGSLLTPLNGIQNGINAVVTGGTVDVAAGTYTQTSTLNVNKGVTLIGAGEGLTTIDARTVSGYGLSVSADNVTLSDFTVYGPSAFFASAYGIKVSPGGSASSRLHNFTISNVTSRGAGKAELDLNGVDGATIDHFTADGTPVGATSGTTQGAGIQLTDSANITVTNSTTRNNAWGGLAIYQANRSYDQQANNITIGANNNFTESNPLFMQNESTLYADFGTLNLPGFSYAVRNPASVGGVLYSQYTWLQPTSQGAFDLAVNLPSPGVSTVQGWSGGARTQDFYVGIGNLTGGGMQAMSIAAAVGTSNSGANIHVGAGTYAENVTVDSLRNLSFSGSTLHSLTVNAGASGSGIGGSVTADTASGLSFNAPVVLLGNTVLDTSAAGGAVSTAAINGTSAGAQTLTINAGSGAVTLGDLGMTTRLGAADVTGAISLNGANYTANSLHFASPVTLTQATTTFATNGGSIAFDGAINGATAGAQALTINAGSGAVTLANLGAATRLGATDVTGTISLAGSTYGADSLHLAGPATLTQATTTLSTSGGNITLDNAINGTTAGAQALTINAATGAVSLGDLGATTRLGATDVTGAISLSGSNFTADSLRFNGAVSLTQSATTLGTSGGAVATGTIDGTAAGAQALTINAGSGAVTLANLGATTRLGATDVTGTTHLAGSTYNADSLHFAGPMTLALATTFSTSGGNITIGGDIQNAGTTPNALSLHAGTDGTRGDVSLVSGGSQSNPLGAFDVTANNLTLTGTLWVRNYRIDGRGAIALSGHTLIATDAAIANTITAVGDVSGSTVSGGSVQASSTGGDVALNVTSQGGASVSGANVSGNIAGTDVTVAAQNNSTANITAQGAANVAGTNVSGTITGNNVTVAAQNSSNASVTAQGSANVSGADISGSISGNTVTVTAQKSVNATVAAQDAANVSGASVSGNFSGTNVAVAAQDVVNVSVTATSTATIDATNTVQATVNAGSASVHAGGNADVSGSTNSLTLQAPSGTVSGNFGEVTNVGSGLVNVNGRPQANTTLATNADNNRVMPSERMILGGAAGGAPGVGLTAIEVPMLPGAVPVSLSSPTRAGEYIMQGRSVEIDLSPRRDEEQK